MIKHIYFSGSKRVEVDEIDDIEIQLHISRSSTKSSLKNKPVLGEMEWEDRIGTDIADMSRIQFEAMRKAGFVFIREPVSDDSAASQVKREVPIERDDESDVLRATVVRDSDGDFQACIGDLCVKFDPDLSCNAVKEILTDAGLEVIWEFKFTPHLYEVRGGCSRRFYEFIAEFGQREEVVWVEPVSIGVFIDEDEINGAEQPDVEEPQNKEWHWATTQVDRAWRITEGDGVRIAVIDKGFHADHQEFTSVSGASVYYSLNRPPKVKPISNPSFFHKHQHGTICAGLVAARRDDADKIKGAAPRSNLMLIACPGNHIYVQTTLARAIAYATDPHCISCDANEPGADIISCSFGPKKKNVFSKMSLILKEAFEFATQKGRNGKGISIFWPVGNGNSVHQNYEIVNHHSVIGVGASGFDDRQGNASSGLGLEFLAPGRRVWCMLSNTRNYWISGTSVATPCAAGIAALVLSRNPDLYWDEVRDIMRDSCVKIWCSDRAGCCGVQAEHFGYGRLDALAAVKFAIERQARLLSREQHPNEPG